MNPNQHLFTVSKVNLETGKRNVLTRNVPKSIAKEVVERSNAKKKPHHSWIVLIYEKQ